MQCHKPEGHKLNYEFAEPSIYLGEECSCSIQHLSLILKSTDLTSDSKLQHIHLPPKWW